jgi:hypothetical protein
MSFAAGFATSLKWVAKKFYMEWKGTSLLRRGGRTHPHPPTPRVVCVADPLSEVAKSVISVHSHGVGNGQKTSLPPVAKLAKWVAKGDG